MNGRGRFCLQPFLIEKRRIKYGQLESGKYLRFFGTENVILLIVLMAMHIDEGSEGHGRL